MRAWASYMACGLGAALVAAACCMPAAVVRTEVSGPVVDVPPALIFQHYLVLPIAGRAFPADSGARAAGDAIPDAGMWPARLILAAALASLCLIAAAMRRAALAAVAALALSGAWLFIESGPASAAGKAPAAGWTAYPPLSAVAEPDAASLLAIAWPAWVALAAGTCLLGAAAWLRREEGRRRDEAAAPRED